MKKSFIFFISWTVTLAICAGALLVKKKRRISGALAKHNGRKAQKKERG